MSERFSDQRGLSSSEKHRTLALRIEHFFTFVSAFRHVTAPVFDFFYKIYRIRFRFETASKCVFNMAVPEDTGLPLMWFKNMGFVRKMYQCAVCLEVVKDPMQVRNCGHQFCRYCIDNVLK